MTRIDLNHDNLIFVKHQNLLNVMKGGKSYSLESSSKFLKEKLGFLDICWNLLVGSFFPQYKWKKIHLTIESKNSLVCTVGYVYEKNLPELPITSFDLESKTSAAGYQLKDYQRATMSRKKQLTLEDLDDQTSTHKEICDAFANTLIFKYCSKYQTISCDTRKAIIYIRDCFEQALEEASANYSSSQSQGRALSIFKDSFISGICKIKIHEMVSKDLFKNLLKVRHGFETTVDLSEPANQKLIYDFKSGAWGDYEDRQVILENMKESEFDRFKPLIDQIIDASKFERVVMGFLSSQP